ncbi:MAG: hypothetical protein CMJ26_05140 [Phycisphaerae bacterium]|nr:hypothetical protein [Phycisphaerae bacterium]
MNLSKKFTVLALISSVTFFGFGCGGEEVVEAPKPKARTVVAKPKPKIKTVDALKDELTIDDRIYFDELEAPRDEPSRVALLEFFNALLSVDEAALQNALSFSDKLELDAMVSAGLAEYMDAVSRVDLKVGLDPAGGSCVMGIFEIGMEYQVQLWNFSGKGKNITFSSLSIPPNLVSTLSGDWIENYFALQAKQAEIALQPDAGASYVLAGETDRAAQSDDDGGGPSGPPKRPGGPAAPGH